VIDLQPVERYWKELDMFTSKTDRNGVIGWIQGSMFGVDVVKEECPRTGGRPYELASQSGAVVVHTVEGTNLKATLDRFREKGSAPIFVPGDGKIYQTRPVWAKTGTLRANPPHDPNFQAQLQMEMLYKLPMDGNKPLPHVPPQGVFLPVAAIFAFCYRYLKIPFTRPSPGWADDGSDFGHTVWATNNIRRQEVVKKNLWPWRGFGGHLEVPWQQDTWHFDPGAFEYQKVFEAAKQLMMRYPDEYQRASLPPVEAPHTDRPVLHPGDQRWHVTLMKQALENFKYNVTDTTNIYDQVTLQLVKAFQKSQGLRDDGIVGPMTWTKLLP
jgi:hypothetical protein